MHPISLTIALVVALAAACADLRTRRIPNALSLGACAAGFVVQLALGGPSGTVVAALGALVTGVPALALFRLRAMGGGDVKLLAACGALVGPVAGVELLLATAVAGGALALAVIAARRAWPATRGNLALLVAHWRAHGLTPCPVVSLGTSRGTAVPYGVAIAAGMLFTFASRFGSLA